MKLVSERIFKIAIIGGGAAGLYIADKLKNKDDLVLIESGDINKYRKDNKNHKFRMSKKSSHILNTDQVAGLGGNTNIWGGQLLPFSSNDINKENGWPFEIDEISTNYSKVSKELLGNDINYFSKTFIEKFTGRRLIDLDNANLKIHISSWLKEPNFKKIFRKLRRRTNILDNYFVNNIKYTKSGYFELSCSNSSIKRKILAKKVVITSGAIQSVRLLLNSSLNKNLQIKNNLGKGFMDHSAIDFIKLDVKNRFSFLREFNTKYLSNGSKVSIRLSASSKYLKNNKSNISGMIMVIPPKNLLKRLLNIISILLTVKFINFIYKPFGDIYLCFLVEQKTCNFSPRER